MPRVWVAVLLLAAVAFACQPAGEQAEEPGEAPPEEAVDEYAAIYDSMEEIAETWNEGDLEASLELLGKEYTQMPPGEEARVGLEEMSAVWAEFLDQNTNVWEPSVTEVQIVGDLAFARGSTTDTTTPKDGGETVVSVADSAWVFRRDADGSWPLIFEYWLPRELAAEAVEAPAAPASEEDAAVLATVDTIAELWNSGDTEATFEYFTEDFAQMPPGEDGRVGLDGIVEVWAQVLAENTAVWEPEVDEVEIVGNLAYARGSAIETITPIDGGESTSAEYNALWVFEQQADGSWKMCFEYWVPKQLLQE